MIPIAEDFDAYAPPAWVTPTVSRLLDSLPPEHLLGLSSIVLTETAKTRKVKMTRKAGRKYSPDWRLGFYRPAWRGEMPAIYLIIDNILSEGRPWLQFGRDFAIGHVLYHEIGHHLNAKVGSISGNEEDSADAWRRKLWRIHARKRYWFLRPVFRVLASVVRPVARMARRRAAAQQAKVRRA